MSRWLNFIVKGIFPLLRAFFRYILTPPTTQDEEKSRPEKNSSTEPTQLSQLPQREHQPNYTSVQAAQQQVQQVVAESQKVHDEVDSRLDELERLLLGKLDKENASVGKLVKED